MLKSSGWGNIQVSVVPAGSFEEKERNMELASDALSSQHHQIALYWQVHSTVWHFQFCQVDSPASSPLGFVVACRL
jgi:hypothetical protein